MKLGKLLERKDNQKQALESSTPRSAADLFGGLPPHKAFAAKPEEILYSVGSFSLDDPLGIYLGLEHTKLNERCFVYLYQTVIVGTRKFGISNNPKQRARSWKTRYIKQLSAIPTETRKDAIVIETAFQEQFGFCTETDEDKKLIGFCTELTKIEKEEFERIIGNLKCELARLCYREFLRHQAPKWATNTEETLNDLRAGKTVLTATRWPNSEKPRFSFVKLNSLTDFGLQANGFYEFKNADINKENTYYLVNWDQYMANLKEQTSK